MRLRYFPEFAFGQGLNMHRSDRLENAQSFSKAREQMPVAIQQYRHIFFPEVLFGSQFHYPAIKGLLFVYLFKMRRPWPNPPSVSPLLLSQRLTDKVVLYESVNPIDHNFRQSSIDLLLFVCEGIKDSTSTRHDFDMRPPETLFL